VARNVLEQPQVVQGSYLYGQPVEGMLLLEVGYGTNFSSHTTHSFDDKTVILPWNRTNLLVKELTTN
jgi:hypothetical protein